MERGLNGSLLFLSSKRSLIKSLVVGSALTSLFLAKNWHTQRDIVLEGFCYVPFLCSFYSILHFSFY